jgi:hypothetical protein
MFEIFFAIFMALSCPAHKHNNTNGQVTTLDADTGGDKGQYPPPPPPPLN